jgi:hypothetical protein
MQIGIISSCSGPTGISTTMRTTEERLPQKHSFYCPMYMAQRNEGICDMNIVVVLRVVGQQEAPQIGILYKGVVILVILRTIFLLHFYTKSPLFLD